MREAVVMRQDFGHDFLMLSLEDAQFINFKKGQYLMLAYYSDAGEDGGYYVNNSELFSLQNLGLAITAYTERLAKPFSRSEKSQQHDEIFVREKPTERPAWVIATGIEAKHRGEGYDQTLKFAVKNGDPTEVSRRVCEFINNMVRGPE